MFLLGSTLCFAGCRSVPSDKVAAFSSGVTTAKTQAHAAFAAVNEVAKEDVIDYAAAQPTLRDQYFYDVLDQASIAQTETVFAALEKYCQSLAALTSPDITKEYKTAAVELGAQINDASAKVKTLGLASNAPVLSPGIATAFVQLGNFILKAQAAADAKRTMRLADPTVEKIFHNMADSIETIRSTVHAHWRRRRDLKAGEFIEPENADKKRAIAVEYAELKDKEAAQDRVLVSLERSFRALADAHHALAQDSHSDVVAAISIVKEEAKDTKDIYDQMKTHLDHNPTSTGEKGAIPIRRKEGEAEGIGDGTDK